MLPVGHPVTLRPVRIAWVSCTEMPEPDPDEEQGLDALRARGHEVSVVAWDDPQVRLEDYDIALLRSPWNYPDAPEAFRDFLARGVGQVWNPPQVTVWNLHKKYLFDLEAGGIDIVPTALGGPGADARALARGRGWSEVVVKPAIGAGSIGARRFSDLDAAAAHGRALGRDFLVQPVLGAFTDPGESSLIWVHGAFTHTVRKRPRLDGEDEAVVLGPPPTPEDKAFAARALRFAPAEILYGRIDYVMHEGRPLLSELELIEPSLFWCLGGAASEALERFVVGVEARRAADRSAPTDGAR